MCDMYDWRMGDYWVNVLLGNLGENMSNFEKLFQLDVNGHIEKKNGLSYLSWAWAWGELKKLCPNARYTIYENKDGWFYHTDGKTCWVKTGVTIDDLEYIEYLPIMDFRNKSIPADQVTSFDVNKAIQRSLTKAVARHGLGLYIYAGEDLPEITTDKKDYSLNEEQKEEIKKAPNSAKLKTICRDMINNLGEEYTKAILAEYNQREAELNANLQSSTKK